MPLVEVKRDEPTHRDSLLATRNPGCKNTRNPAERKWGLTFARTAS
jgi:hypothetical protein